MEIVPASKFTFAQLTEAYNQSRIDYLVPMPMNEARLREYVRVYSVDLDCSCIAQSGREMWGIGMLGIRPLRTWITRLGVLPQGRRKGTGGQIMECLLRQSYQTNAQQIWLEVIKHNKPAHTLFSKYNFIETRELIVARRPPSAEIDLDLMNLVEQVTPLSHEEAIILLSHRKQRANWLNETESLQNVQNLSGLLVTLKNGGRGWITYHASVLQLTRILVEVLEGSAEEVTAVLLQLMHNRHKRLDAVTENLAEDEYWQGFQRLGYFESFRRIEMVKEL